MLCVREQSEQFIKIEGLTVNSKGGANAKTLTHKIDASQLAQESQSSNVRKRQPHHNFSATHPPAAA